MLTIKNLNLSLNNFSLRDINLSLGPKDYLVILGQTGSGKTLLLETLAGRYLPNSGNIYFNGNNISILPPEKRKIGFLYQSYELFPHFTVKENIYFPLKFSKEKIPESFIDSLIKTLNISHLLNRRIHNLSGGEKQRIALCRALVTKPQLVFLDEPLSALDYITKTEAKNLIKKIYEEYQPIVIHVTHDISEALFFATKISIMKSGNLVKTFHMKQDKILEKGEEIFYEYF